MQRTKTSVLVAVTALFWLVAPASAETLTLAWDLNPEPEVAGYIVHVGPEPGMYTSHVDVGNKAKYVLTTAVAGRRYCFAVSAYFPGPIEGSRSVDVCTEGNLPPTLANPGAQSNPLGHPVSLALAATDPESAPLTFSASALPTGLSIARTTGLITGTPTHAGSSTARVTVSDGVHSTNQEFPWTIVSSAPAAPTLLRPTGAQTTTTPTFEWQPVGTATRYRLWVDDASNVNPRVQLDLTPADAGCASSGTVCRVNPGVVLAAGAASWSVRATNSAGDGPWSGAMDFTVPDGRAPLVAISMPTAAATFSTSTATVALAGTASDDIAVTQLTWANNRGGSGTAVGTSTWTIASVPLQGGANVITVTARDAQNNVSTDVLTVTKSDGHAPTVEILLPTTSPSFSTSGATLTVAGVARDDVGVTEVRWANSRGGSGTAQGISNGSVGVLNWSVALLPLHPGANAITVTARDAAGLTGTATLTVTMTDGAPPTIAFTTPTSGSAFSTTRESIGIGGSASDDFGVTRVSWVNNRGGAGAAAGTTAWSSTVPLQVGANGITVTAYDAAGRSATDFVTITRTDGDSPVVSITSPTTAPSHSTKVSTLALAGTATDAAAVVQVTWSNDRGGGGSALGTASWGVGGVALKSGVNVITVTARDEAGNTGRDTLAVTLTDGEAPTIRIVSPTSAPTFTTGVPTISLGGTAADDSGTVRVAWTSSAGGSGTAVGTTTWSITNLSLKAGANVITVSASDAAGNTSKATLTVTANDAQKPTVTIDAPTGATRFVTNQVHVALSGAARDDFGVARVTWSNDRGGSGSAAGTTMWAVPVLALQPGANVITISAADAAGNVATDVLTVVVDNRRPTVAIRLPAAASSHAATTATLDLAGTADDDIGVTEVSWSSDRGGRGMATGSRAWTAPGVPLAPGVNTLTVTARDEAGNTASAVLTVVKDTKAPGVVIEGPTTEPTLLTNTATLALRGTAHDDVGVTQVMWSNDRGGNGTTVGATAWTVPAVPLLAGRNVITVTARDAVGNTATDSIVVTLDTNAPGVSITSPGRQGTVTSSSATVVLGGVAFDDAGIAQVSWTSNRGASGLASGTATWSTPPVRLESGQNVFTVTARDAAGNRATATLIVQYNETATPAATSSPSTPTPTSTSGTTQDPSAVTPLLQPWPGGAPASMPMAAPTQISQTDAGSLADSLPVSRTVATPGAEDAGVTQDLEPSLPPVISIASPAGERFVTADNTLTIAGTARHRSGITQVTWSTDRGTSGVAVGGDRWTIRNLPLSAGATVLTVTARSALGNLASDVVVLVRSEPIRVAVEGPTAEPAWTTAAGTVGLRGVASDNVVRVTWAADWGGTGTASGTRQWSIPTIGLQIGLNRITIKAFDTAGGSSERVVAITYSPQLAASR